MSTLNKKEVSQSSQGFFSTEPPGMYPPKVATVTAPEQPIVEGTEPAGGGTYYTSSGLKL